MLIFSVYDKKACVHKTPFFAQCKEDAIRSFYRLANDARSDVNLFPDDFALYYIGGLDVDTGKLSGFTPVEHVVDAMALIKVDKGVES